LEPGLRSLVLGHTSLPVLRHEDYVSGHADDLIFLIAEQALGADVPTRGQTICVRSENREVRRTFDDQFEQLFLLSDPSNNGRLRFLVDVRPPLTSTVMRSSFNEQSLRTQRKKQSFCIPAGSQITAHEVTQFEGIVHRWSLDMVTSRIDTRREPSEENHDRPGGLLACRASQAAITKTCSHKAKRRRAVAAQRRFT
jgi:hypothetical protein